MKVILPWVLSSWRSRGFFSASRTIKGAGALRPAGVLGPSGMSLAAGGPPGKEEAFFSRQAVEEGAALEDGDVVRYGKCSSCWWKTSLRRLKWPRGGGEIRNRESALRRHDVRGYARGRSDVCDDPWAGGSRQPGAWAGGLRGAARGPGCRVSGQTRKLCLSGNCL